jgi:transcriptional regulator with XRE-family HTH domain
MNFNEKLMQLRKERGFSQEELGNRVDVTRQTVSKWELGQTTPEMDKLIELARLFSVSIDELTGNECAPPKGQPFVVYPRTTHYEYKSKRLLFGMPLVHVNVGVGIRRARGIIAVGTVATGIVTVGVVSLGVVALGALSLGLIALGALCIGVAALGALAVGALAVGGVAVGLLAIGGLALGVYSLGGFASALRIAVGGYARGHIALGDVAKGDYTWEKIGELTAADYQNIKDTILREYPDIWRWLLRLFVKA